MSDRHSIAGIKDNKAFTLIEMLMVLGLMGILTGIVVVNADALFKGLGTEPLDETLRRAVREARYQAASKKTEVHLHFDAQSAQFTISDAGGQVLSNVESDYSEGEVEVTFFRLQPAKGIGIMARTETEARPVRFVRFNPDRSSTVFETHLRYDGLESRHRYDPFSSIELKDESENGSG